MWFQRAVDYEIPESEAGLDVIRKKRETDLFLDSVKFDTFGWKPSHNRDSFRRWTLDKASLSERFFNVPPDFPSWNANDIRKTIEQARGMVQSQSFNIEDLDLPSWIEARTWEVPQQATLLEVECSIRPAKCVMTLWHRTDSPPVPWISRLFLAAPASQFG